MKKLTLLSLAFVVFGFAASAQTEKNYYLIGSDLANINVNFQKGNTGFGIGISPKVAWFIQDNLAVGAAVDLGLKTSKGFTSSTYGVGPLVRYYFPTKDVSIMKKTRVFGEANVGIFGQNTKVSGSPSVNTNGLGFGFGPGVAYFLNKNISLESLLKYNGTVGFGNSTTNNALNFTLGFQIYLPQSKLKAMRNETK